MERKMETLGGLDCGSARDPFLVGSEISAKTMKAAA